MATASTVQFRTPVEYSTEMEYVVVTHSVLIGGVQLSKGDRLPSDNLVRQNPRRLEVLCRQRILAPVFDVQRAQEQEESAGAPSKQKKRGGKKK